MIRIPANPGRHILRWFSAALLLVPLTLTAQEDDFTAIVSGEVNMPLVRRWDASFEQEFIFSNNASNFYRSKSTIGVDYGLIRKKLKAGFAYSLIRKEEDYAYFETRHRFAVTLTYKEEVKRNLTMAFRSRFQTTLRDESRGDYRINPRNYWRNRLQVRYQMPRLPLRPELSCEVFYPLNRETPNLIDAWRVTAGMEYQWNKRNAVSLYWRLDREQNVSNPLRTYSVGVGYVFSM